MRTYMSIGIVALLALLTISAAGAGYYVHLEKTAAAHATATAQAQQRRIAAAHAAATAQAKQQGDLQVCQLSHYDSTNDRCLQEDHTFQKSDSTAKIILNVGDISRYYGLEVDEKDGTGTWTSLAQIPGIGIEGVGASTPGWSIGEAAMDNTVSNVVQEFRLAGTGTSFPPCNTPLRFVLQTADDARADGTFEGWIKSIGIDTVTFTCN